jgi:hypothetical protein
MNESDYRARRQQYEVPIGPPRHTELRAPGTKAKSGVTAGGPYSISSFGVGCPQPMGY